MANKDEKFDSFLKRTLNKKVYQHVKTSDPCVILSLSTKEKYTFRHVFCTDECLFLTENPPKSIVLSIPFKNFQDVQILHDKATFLQKELQETTLHILVKYVSGDGNFTASGIGIYQASYSKTAKTHHVNQSKLQHHVSAESQNSIWKNLKSTFSRSSPSQHSSDGKASLSNDGKVDDNDSLCGLGFSRASTPSHDFHPKYMADLEESGEALFADNVDGSVSFAAEKASHLVTKWTAKDTFQIENLENDKFPSCKLHLFLLSGSSTFYPMLRSVWKAYLLKAAFDIARPLHSKQSDQIQNFTKPFLEALRSDILRSFLRTTSIEDVYRYFLEMKSVIKESPAGKAYFWKDREVITVIANLLTKFTSSRSQKQQTKMDEIECTILIFETLAEMLRHTEAMPACIDMLQTIRTEIYAKLISACLRTPLSASMETSLLDEEMQSLLREYTAVVCEVLYELIEVANRVSWSNQRSDNLFKSSFLFAQLDANSNLLNFLKTVVANGVHTWTTDTHKRNDSLHVPPTSLHVPSTTESVILGESHHSVKFASSSLLSSSPPLSQFGSSVFHGDPLSAQDVVTFHRNFTVLHRCFSKCKSIKDIFKGTFKEEFTYYFRPETFEVKIPSLYPAAGITRNMIKGVVHLVTDQTIASSASQAPGFE